MKMIPEFELILTENPAVTNMSYCMLYSYRVELSQEPIFGTVENEDSEKRNQLVGQFYKRYSNTLDFTHWNSEHNGNK